MMESFESDKVNVQDVLSTQIADLQIVDDFIWVDKPFPEILTDNSKRNNTVFTNIAQYETNGLNNTVELPRTECNEDGTRLVLDKQVTREEQYWDQRGVVIEKVKSKQKLQNSRRKTVKEYNIIAASNTIPRHLSYYKLDYHTTEALETLSLRLGLYMNIAGKGQNSVVIYAKYKPAFCSFYYPSGFAIKVHKLSSDVKKNCALMKLAKKEVQHLQCLYRTSARYPACIPHCLYRVKNILVMNFIGHDQETAPSVDDLPAEVCVQIYETAVNEMYNWYNKAGIVHGRLTNKNIVYYLDKPCFLGWSHSVRRCHPQALTKLMKDCHFLTNYFRSRGVTVKPRDELFKEITGLDTISKELMEMLHNEDLWKQKHLTNPNRNCEDVLSTGRCRFK